MILFQVREKKESNNLTKEQLLSAVQEASRLASSLYSSAHSSNLNLSRSASSVGERQSADYAAPALPKRAETFSEFDGSQTGTVGSLSIPGSLQLRSSGQKPINESGRKEEMLLEECNRLQLDRGGRTK